MFRNIVHCSIGQGCPDILHCGCLMPLFSVLQCTPALAGVGQCVLIVPPTPRAAQSQPLLTCCCVRNKSEAVSFRAARLHFVSSHFCYQLRDVCLQWVVQMALERSGMVL